MLTGVCVFCFPDTATIAACRAAAPRVVARALHQDQQMDFSRFCLCGSKNGSVVTLYKCGQERTYFPFACVVGPHWPCILVTTACIIVPSVIIIIYLYVHLARRRACSDQGLRHATRAQTPAGSGLVTGAWLGYERVCP